MCKIKVGMDYHEGKSPGQILYESIEGYYTEHGGETFRKCPIPAWDSVVPKNIKDVHEYAAKVLIEWYEDRTSKGKKGE